MVQRTKGSNRIQLPHGENRGLFRLLLAEKSGLSFVSQSLSIELDVINSHIQQKTTTIY